MSEINLRIFLSFGSTDEMKTQKQSCETVSVPLKSPFPSTPPREVALYPFSGMEVKGWVTTRTIVTEG